MACSRTDGRPRPGPFPGGILGIDRDPGRRRADSGGPPRLGAARQPAGVRAGLGIALALALTFTPGQPALGDCPAGPPRRIVSLAPSVTEVLFALGLGARIVGVSSRSDFPRQARALPRVGSFVAPNVEAVIARRPDLVITVPSPGNRDAVEAIERTGITVQVVRVDSLAQTEQAMLEIGKCTGASAEARAAVKRIKGELAAIDKQLAGAAARKVLVVVGREPLVVAGPANFLGELVGRAHGLNVAPPRSRWPALNMEAVIAADPDVIIDTSMGSESEAEGRESARFWGAFPSLKAVREERIVTVRSDRLLRPGPRLVEGLKELAAIIHPERF